MMNAGWSMLTTISSSQTLPFCTEETDSLWLQDTTQVQSGTFSYKHTHSFNLNFFIQVAIYRDLPAPQDFSNEQNNRTVCVSLSLIGFEVEVELSWDWCFKLTGSLVDPLKVSKCLFLIDHFVSCYKAQWINSETFIRTTLKRVLTYLFHHRLVHSYNPAEECSSSSSFHKPVCSWQSLASTPSRFAPEAPEVRNSRSATPALRTRVPKSSLANFSHSPFFLPPSLPQRGM